MGREREEGGCEGQSSNMQGRGGGEGFTALAKEEKLKFMAVRSSSPTKAKLINRDGVRGSEVKLKPTAAAE